MSDDPALEKSKYAIHKFNKCLPCTRFCKSYKEPLFGSLTFFNFCSVLRRASQRNHLLHQISNIKLFDNIRAYYESEPCKVNNVLILSFILMKNSTYFRSDSEHVLYNLRARGFKSNHCRNLSIRERCESTQLLGSLVKFTFYVKLTLNVLFAYPSRLCWDLFLRVLMRHIQIVILCVDKEGKRRRK